MDELTLAEIADMAGAKILRGNPAVRVSRVSKDSRTAEPGDLYVALRGEHFDGNEFAAGAASRGAAAVLLDREPSGLPDDLPVLLAGDGLAALTRLAAGWRARLDLKVLCITGSNGKTSTKEFAAAVLGEKFRVAKTRGNLNNHIGVPLSILAATSADTAAVWEIGMNHPGEIAPLAALARPDAAIITNVGVSHIEHMKSLGAIEREKGMLAEAVPAGGFVVLSAGDPSSDAIAARCKARVVRAGLNKGELTAGSIDKGELTAGSIVESDTGCSFVVHFSGRKIEASITANGAHMVGNALLALAAGLELGLPLEKAVHGLARARLAEGRLQRKVIREIVFLDDTYNANPDSMEAALATLRSLPGAGRRIAVLGRMGELGDYATEGCRRTGFAAGSRADILITVGREAAAIAEAARGAGLSRIHEVDDTASAVLMLGNLARPGDIVLVKGSRSARMEAVIQHFET